MVKKNSQFVIHGPNKLRGEVEPSGAKNAVLKEIAACLLTDQKVILDNVPRILDVKNMLKLIVKLGAQVKWLGKNRVEIICRELSTSEVDSQLAGAMRASVVLVGPLLGRMKKAVLPATGGDKIGQRPIDTHLTGFQKLGVKIRQTKNQYIFEAGSAQPTQLFLDEMSVTATENLIMLAVKIPGQTIMRGAAAEPEVEDLAVMLNKMGAKIKGAGSHTISITGVKQLTGARHRVLPDRIEAGTLACASLASQGKVTIKNVVLEHLENLLNRLDKMEANYEIKKLKKTSGRTWIDLILKPSTNNLKPIFIDTRPYPGFSTDLQAPMTLLLTQAQGQSRIFETLFEGRLTYAKELNKMGAKIKIKDEHNIIITGPTKLSGQTICTTDIRAGATLVLAGLIASGKTVVKNVGILDRGYENLEEKLRSLGAKITRI